MQAIAVHAVGDDIFFYQELIALYNTKGVCWNLLPYTSTNDIAVLTIYIFIYIGEK